MRRALVPLALLLILPLGSALPPGATPPTTVLASLGSDAVGTMDLVMRLDVATGAESPLAPFPHACCFTSDSALHASDHVSTYYFVRSVTSSERRLTGVDVHTGAVTTSVPMPPLPYGAAGLELDPATGRFLFAHMDTLWVFDPATGALDVRAILMDGGFDPRVADVDAHADRYYAKVYPLEFGAPPRLMGFDLATGAVVANVPVVGDFFALQADPRTGDLYAYRPGSFLDPTLIRMDPATGTITDVATLGGTVHVGATALDFDTRLMVSTLTQLAPGGGYETTLQAFDLDTGALAWRTPVAPSSVAFEFMGKPLPEPGDEPTVPEEIAGIPIPG